MKKWIAKLLVMVMTLTFVPVSVFAETTTSEETAPEWGIYTCSYLGVPDELVSDTIEVCYGQQIYTDVPNTRYLIAGYFEGQTFIPVDVTWGASEEGFFAGSYNESKHVYTVMTSSASIGKTATLTATDENQKQKQCSVKSPVVFNPASGKPYDLDGNPINKTKLEVGKQYYLPVYLNVYTYGEASLEEIKKNIGGVSNINVEFLLEDGNTAPITLDKIDFEILNKETDVCGINIYFTLTERIEKSNRFDLYCWISGDEKNKPKFISKGYSLSAELSKSYLYITDLDTSEQLTYKEAGNDVTDTAEWTSSDPKVVTVQNGKVTPVGFGTAIITAKGAYSASCKVYCYEDGVYIDGKPTTEYTWNKEEHNSDTLNLDLYKGARSSIQDFWFSSNTDIATITGPGVGEDGTLVDNGIVTFKKNGIVTFYAVSSNSAGGFPVLGSCTVTVTGFDSESDLDKGWELVENYQYFRTAFTNIKLSSHKVENQTYNEMIFENRITEPTIKAGSCSFTIQLTENSKTGGSGPSLEEVLTPEVKERTIKAALQEITVCKQEEDGTPGEVVASYDNGGITLKKDPDFDTSGNILVTYQINVKNLERDTPYVLVVGPKIKALNTSLYKEAQYQFTTAAAAKTITLDKSELTLKAGAAETLTAALDANAETQPDDIVVWTSDKDAIATVDNNGNVTAKKAGTAVITARALYGGVIATCTVTVEADAVDPTDPTEPTDPLNPIGPVDPADPSDSGQKDDGTAAGGDNAAETSSNSTDSAKTGDDMNLWVLAGIMLISLCGAAGTVLYRRKQKMNE